MGEDAASLLGQALLALQQARDMKPGREVSVAITKTEEAQMWLAKAARIVGGTEGESGPPGTT